MKSTMRLSAFLALAVCATISAAPGSSGTTSALKNAVILIIRHAEKPESGTDLSTAGEARAQAYAGYFERYTIDGQSHRPDQLFATRDSSASDRPSLTIEPTAKALGLEIDTRFDDNQFQKLAEFLRSSPHGTNILICWHHGRIPDLLQALGANPRNLLPDGKWPNAVFGWLIQLRYDENGQLFESKRITENFSPADSSASPAEPASGSGRIAKPPPRSLQGGMDPHGDSWASIKNSLQQFGNSQYLLRLFFSLLLSVACAWGVMWSPRRLGRFDSLSSLEERKTLILLGLVGAVVAELSSVSHSLAFVIFGIGALLRMRTVLDNPKLTGKAITVVVIGLACGMGSWTMAVFVTIVTWVLFYWLDSHVACRIEIRPAKEADPKQVLETLQALFFARRCRLQSSEHLKGGRQLVFHLRIPADLDPRQLEQDMRAKLSAGEDARIKITT